MRLVSSPLALLLALLLPLCWAIPPTSAPSPAPTPAPTMPDFFWPALFDFNENLWGIFNRFWDILNSWPQYQYNMTP